MSVYLDASVLLPLIIEEESSPAMARLVSRGEGALLLSDFAATEVSSAFSLMIRTRRVSRREAEAALADFDGLRASLLTPVQIASSDLAMADGYVRNFDLELRAPDAIHLAAALRLGATLVTLDRKMAKAARALGIPIEQPE